MGLMSIGMIENECIEEEKILKELVNIGTFNINIVHYAFMKRLQEFGEEPSTL